MMLTEQEINQYKTDGYVVPDYRVPSEILDSIDAKTDSFIAKNPQFRDNCSALLRQDISFANFCFAPGILDMASQLIGPDIALWNMSLFGKPANDGKATPWHQDGEYWPIRPLATCSVWVAVDESSEENGCLEVIPGSHRDKSLREHQHNPSADLTLHEELLDTEFDSKQAQKILLERGQISMHDVFLMHGSKPNRSNKRRRGMTMRLMPTTSHFDRSIAQDALANHPLMLVRGRDKCGKNDLQEPGDLLQKIA